MYVLHILHGHFRLFQFIVFPLKDPREIFYFLEKDYMFEILYALVSFTNFAVVL